MDMNIPTSKLVAQFESDSISGKKIAPSYESSSTKLPISKYFSKTTKNEVIFIGEYMELYIPVKDIERKTAVISGREVYTFGVFEIHIWDKEPVDPAKEKPTYITRYMCPTKFKTIPSSITKRTMSVDGESEEPHMVLGYKKNDPYIKNTTLVKSSVNVSRFINTIFGAFLSKLVEYDDLVPLTLECAALNGVGFSLNATTLEMIYASQARAKSDPTIPFRIYLNKKGDDKSSRSDMLFIKITEIPHITSTFTSFTFQNIDFAITSSARRHRKGQKQVKSAVEDIIKY